MPEPLNIAVLGCGMLARSQHIPNILACPEARLHLCCDLDETSLEECRRLAPGVRTTSDFRRVFEDPDVDAIVLATTEHFRLPAIEAAARAGTPVYCEKPLAKDLKEALAILNLVQSSGIPFCVGHNRRCSPALVAAQKIFSSHMRNPQPCPWRFDRNGAARKDLESEERQAGISIRINDDWWSWKEIHMRGQNEEIGLLLSENTHFTDIACWFLEDEPEEVTTVFSSVLVNQVSIKFRGGSLASIFSCANGSFGYPKELYEAMGRGGVVVVDHMLEVRTSGITGEPPVRTFPLLNDRHPGIGTQDGLHGWLEKKEQACREAGEKGDTLLQFAAEPDKGHARMLGEFLREIRGERGPVSPVAAAVKALGICLASVRSKREGRTVHMSEIFPP